MWKIESRSYRLPFRQGVRTAHGLWQDREGWILRIEKVANPRAGSTTKATEPTEPAENALGAIGWGEVAPIPWFGTETLAAAAEALATLRGEATDEAEALSRVPEACPCLRAGLAAAFADAAFVAPPQPRAPTESNRVNALPIAALLPAGRAALTAVSGQLERGFRTFKWKVGVAPAADEWALVDDLIGALPAGAKVRLDANGAWDRRTAHRWLERAAERPLIEYIEQPCLPAPNSSVAETRKIEDTLRGLAEDFPVKIALDESLVGASDVARWLSAEWQGVWIIKPSLLGSPSPTLAALANARADVVFGSALESSVGARGGLRLAFQWAEQIAASRNPLSLPHRALGYGVWPLFQEPTANGGPTGPFVRREDIERINPQELWTALN